MDVPGCNITTFWQPKGYISYRPVPTADSRYIEPRSSGYRPRTVVLYIDYRPGDRSITYTYISIAFSIELQLRVSRSLSSLANYVLVKRFLFQFYGAEK